MLTFTSFHLVLLSDNVPLLRLRPVISTVQVQDWSDWMVYHLPAAVSASTICLRSLPLNNFRTACLPAHQPPGPPAQVKTWCFSWNSDNLQPVQISRACWSPPSGLTHPPGQVLISISEREWHGHWGDGAQTWDPASLMKGSMRFSCRLQTPSADGLVNNAAPEVKTQL